MRPDLGKPACRQAAMMIYALLVGSTPFYADDPDLARRRRGFDDRIKRAILDLIGAAR